MSTTDIISDSLPDNTEKADFLNELSEKEREHDIASSLKHANEAIRLSNSLKYQPGLAKGFWQQGVCNRLKSEYKSAFTSFESALRIYYELNDKKGISKVLNSIANIYTDLKEYKKALELLLKSYDIISSTDEKEFAQTVIFNIAIQYQATGNYEKALYYFNDLIKNENKVLFHSIYYNLGLIQFELDNYNSSIDYLLKSLEQNTFDKLSEEKGFIYINIADAYARNGNKQSAAEYFNLALESLDKYRSITPVEPDMYSDEQISSFMLDLNFKMLKLREILNDKNGMCASYISIGDLYYNNSDFSNAKNYFFDCYDLSIKNKNEVYFSISLIRSSNVELIRNNTDKSIEMLLKAYESSSKRNSKCELAKIHYALYQVYKKEGNFIKALNHHEEFYRYEHELNSFCLNLNIK